MTFDWDINTAGVLAVIAQGVALVVFWVRTSDTAASAKRDAAAAEELARAALDKLALHIGVHQMFREEVAKEYISRDLLRDFEERFGGDIRKLSSAMEMLTTRIDRALERKT
jgi:protoporphyrinogen oxidase